MSPRKKKKAVRAKKKKTVRRKTSAAVRGAKAREADEALGVEDIPGAIAPEQAADAGSADSGALRGRLAALRQRGGAGRGRAAGAGGGGRGRGAGLGRRQGAAAQSSASGDPIASGKKILAQLSSRLAEGGDDTDATTKRRPLRTALRGIARGYRAMEEELERLRAELEQARSELRRRR